MTAELPATLLEVLEARFPGASRTTLRQMLARDRVRVNGTPERVARREIVPSDLVEVVGRRPLDPRLRILYQDREVVVVDKAAGLLSVPSPVVRHETAESFLNVHAGAPPGEVWIHHVHRLDRETSGVLLFAKGLVMRDRLQEQLAGHEVERLYVAIVEGKPRPPRGTLRGFLEEGSDLVVRPVADASRGKEAVTHFRTIASGRRYAMLEVRLETGRRHQIRVQLAGAGHPVVGDTHYGGAWDPDLGRLGLHARRLAFVHPRTRQRLAFEAKLPEAFRALAL